MRLCGDAGGGESEGGKEEQGSLHRTCTLINNNKALYTLKQISSDIMIFLCSYLLFVVLMA